MPRKVTTQKVSVSLPGDVLDALRAHAKRKYGGNLSAAIAALARLARYEDGADALMEWIGEVPEADRAALAAEWASPLRPPAATKRRRKAA